jgi:hypothetical protein
MKRRTIFTAPFFLGLAACGKQSSGLVLSGGHGARSAAAAAASGMRVVGEGLHNTSTYPGRAIYNNMFGLAGEVLGKVGGQQIVSLSLPSLVVWDWMQGGDGSRFLAGIPASEIILSASTPTIAPDFSGHGRVDNRHVSSSVLFQGNSSHRLERISISTPAFNAICFVRFYNDKVSREEFADDPREQASAWLFRPKEGATLAQLNEHLKNTDFGALIGRVDAIVNRNFELRQEYGETGDFATLATSPFASPHDTTYDFASMFGHRGPTITTMARSVFSSNRDEPPRIPERNTVEVIVARRRPVSVAFFR